MNETQPPQKQDIDRLGRLLAALLDELRELRADIQWATRDDPREVAADGPSPKE